MAIAAESQDILRQLLEITEKYQDPLMMKYLAKVTLNEIEIERLAMQARQGNYEKQRRPVQE